MKKITKFLKFCTLKKLSSFLYPFISGLLSGFWGSGGGVVMHSYFKKSSLLELDPINECGRKDNEKNIYPSIMAVSLPISVVCSIIRQKDAPTSNTPFPCLLISILGGISGCFLFSKLKPKWLDTVFAVLMMTCGAFMIFL